MNVRNVFFINFLLAILWIALQADLSAGGFLMGFIISFILLAVMHRGYGASVMGAISFFLFLMWAIIVSSFQVAGYVLAPKLKLDQGIIEIPLDARTDLEIAILASSITLTPGTLSVNVGTASGGRRVLYVHSLVMGDADELRKTIKQDFERRILRMTRGGVHA